MITGKFKVAVEKLQRTLSLSRKLTSGTSADITTVPEDVKEGHFAVVAVAGEEPKRLVVPLSCLRNPTFVRLLEMAAEEYGFVHEGALTIPCPAREVEKILADHWKWERKRESRKERIWGNSSQAIIQSY